MGGIRPARFPDDAVAIRGLLLEYADGIGLDLSFQGFDQEVASLPGDYAPPGGALLVAEALPIGVMGCVALRRIDRGSCEMKRLFVTGKGRGRGIGKALAVAIIEAGRRMGYRRIRLDTMPSQESAHRLYRELGFVEIDPYRHNPVAGARFLELRL